MPLVQVQQGEPFKHCSGSAFLLSETRLKLRGEVGGKGREAPPQQPPEPRRFSVLAGVGGFLDRVGEVLGFISGCVNTFVGFFKGGVVGIKVTLLAVENRMRIVRLYLSALGSSVILAE